jgi:hypothetical protein
MIDVQDLMARPAWAFEDFAKVLDLPNSTLEVEIKRLPAPLFLLGRRRYILATDALKWLQEISIRNAHTPRINRRGGAK